MAKLIIKNSNGTVDVANNHKESNTLMRYCLWLVYLENKVVCVKLNDTDVFTSCLATMKMVLTLLIAWSNEKWVNLTKVYEQLGAEKANTLIGFHCFSDCDTVEKLTGKSKDTWTKLFLNSDLDVFKTFQLLPRGW